MGRLKAVASAAAGLMTLSRPETRCPVCAAPHIRGRITINPGTAQVPCPDCAASMPRRTGGFCPRCGRLNDVAHEPPTPCGACLRDPGPWENIYFHGPYQGRLRRLILAYKFENALGLDSLLGGLLSGACLDSPCWRPPDLVVPVPLHPARLRWRGFNQSLELARPLARKAGVRIDSRALVRTRKTKPQTQVRDYRERAANLRQAFAAGPGLDGASVLLVDDVTTTGATLLECARALRDAGAARVDAAVLART